VRKFASQLQMAVAFTMLAGAPALAAPQLPHPAASVDESSARIVRMAARNGQPENQHITLGLNKAVVVELDTDAKDVLVSSPDIVDAVVKTPRRIFLMATKTGQTNAFFQVGNMNYGRSASIDKWT